MLEGLAEEWHAFRDDSPGERFAHHNDRMKRRSKAVRFGALALGGLLVAGGVVMLFIPGPGLLVSVFGLALFAGQWRGLAKVLDRAEPPLRRRARAVKRWWTARSRPIQVVLVAVMVIGAATAAYFAWQWWRG